MYVVCACAFGWASFAEAVKTLTLAEIRPAVVTTVSDAFRSDVRKALDSIPDPIGRELRRRGWRVQVAEFVIDAAPRLRGQHPRGWPANLTWENTDAVHLSKSRLLVFAEKRRSTSTGEIVLCGRTVGVVRHEIGHAVDSAGSRLRVPYSSTPRFHAAYRLDIRQMSDAQRKELQYYLQNDRAGRQEAFAEAFALLLGGGSDTKKQAAFRAAFPRVIGHVNKVIESY